MFFISPPFGNYFSIPDTIPIRGSFTLFPRPGIIRRTIETLRYNISLGEWKNEIGLRNKGIDHAVQTYQKGEIISIAFVEGDKKEIDALAQKIPKDMDIELNISCPNVKKRKKSPEGLEIFLSDEREWCIVKLSPLSPMEDVEKYYKEGFRQFHFSNTVPHSYITGNQNDTGGVSGKYIKEMNKKIIPEAKEKFPDIEIIGGGGISDFVDVQDYHSWGADHFSISTVLFNPISSYRLYKSNIRN